MTPDQPCVDCLDHSVTAGQRRLAVPREAGFCASGYVSDFAAVLALSILLAALSLFALAGIVRAFGPGRTAVSQ